MQAPLWQRLWASQWLESGLSGDMWHPEGGSSLGIKGSQVCTNQPPFGPHSCPMWVTSPLEHPLRSFRLSLIQAHLTCGCPPSFATVHRVVSTRTSQSIHLLLPWHPLLHPWHLYDSHLSCLQIHAMPSNITSIPPIGIWTRPSASSMELG